MHMCPTNDLIINEMMINIGWKQDPIVVCLSSLLLRVVKHVRMTPANFDRNQYWSSMCFDFG